MVELVSNVVTIFLALANGGAFIYGFYTGINAS
jgi:hypothetical protein